MLSLPSPLALMSGPLTLLLLLSLPPPQEVTTSVSAMTAITTKAASRALRLVDTPLFIRTLLLGCADDTGVFTAPDERDSASPKRLGVLEAGLRILTDDHELAAAVERDDEARGRTRVHAVADGSRRAAVVFA